MHISPSFSIGIGLLRFYRRLFPLILSTVIATHRFIAMELTRVIVSYRYGIFHRQ